jgi:hypothetical protein
MAIVATREVDATIACSILLVDPKADVRDVLVQDLSNSSYHRANTSTWRVPADTAKPASATAWS